MAFQSALNGLLSDWRDANQDKLFPRFDYRVTTPPHTLVLLESPGPQVRNSEAVSVFNEDGTAKEVRRLLDIGFDQKDQAGVLLWNAIPWFLDRKPRKSDTAKAKPFHNQLLAVLRPNLKYVVLLGQHAIGLLPYFTPRVGRAHIYGGHHPGRQAQIQPGLKAENNAVFSLLRSR